MVLCLKRKFRVHRETISKGLDKIAVQYPDMGIVEEESLADGVSVVRIKDGCEDRFKCEVERVFKDKVTGVMVGKAIVMSAKSVEEVKEIVGNLAVKYRCRVMGEPCVVSGKGKERCFRVRITTDRELTSRVNSIREDIDSMYGKLVYCAY